MKKQALYLALLFMSVIIVSCNKDEVTPEEENAQIEEYITKNNITVTEKTTSGLRFILIQSTTGAGVKSGQLVTVKYTGKLLSGKVFDSGVYPFNLNTGAAIQGFDEGVSKMRVGEKAMLIFPSSLGYGYMGSGSSIGPYTPLLFEIELVSAK